MKKEMNKKIMCDVADVCDSSAISEAVRKMAAIDIREVNAAELVDVESVHIDQKLPVKERVIDYIRQVKNPYCYISHGVVVKIGFSGTKTLEECLGACISMEA